MGHGVLVGTVHKLEKLSAHDGTLNRHLRYLIVLGTLQSLYLMVSAAFFWTCAVDSIESDGFLECEDLASTHLIPKQPD